MKASLLAALLAVTFGAAPAFAAGADDFPSRVVTIVLPLPPGGASDRASRLLADHLSTVWKQPVIVENRPGGNGLVAASAVARSEADGYTLLFCTPSFSTMKALIAKPGFDPLVDFAPISQLTSSPFILAVSSELPVKDVAELIAYAKARPGVLNFGTFGGGQRLAFEYFQQMSGINIQPIQYKGEAPMMLALSTNEVQVTLASAVTILPLVEAGRVKALAVTTADRAPSTPTIPTIAESALPGYDVSVWYGVLAPSKTPADIQQKIAREIAAFAKRPEMVKDFAQVNYTLKSSTPAEFRALIDSEVTRWADVGAKAGIKPE